MILLATVAFVAAPSVTPPFMGYDPGMFPVSIARPSVQPAGYAFAIWGVIYLWLLISAAFGLAAARRSGVGAHPPQPFCGAAAGHRLARHRQRLPDQRHHHDRRHGSLLSDQFSCRQPDAGPLAPAGPLALFAGWLTAASCVSLGVILAGYGWLGDTGAALAMLVLALVIAITVQLRRRSMPVYSVAVIWAAIGIVVVNWTPNPTVAYAALLGAALQSAVAVTGFLRR